MFPNASDAGLQTAAPDIEMKRTNAAIAQMATR
jgi:hypothetical protein